MIDFSIHAGPKSNKSDGPCLHTGELPEVSVLQQVTAYKRDDGSNGTAYHVLLFFQDAKSLDRLISTLVEARKGFPE